MGEQKLNNVLELPLRSQAEQLEPKWPTDMNADLHESYQDVLRTDRERVKRVNEQIPGIQTQLGNPSKENPREHQRGSNLIRNDISPHISMEPYFSYAEHSVPRDPH